MYRVKIDITTSTFRQIKMLANDYDVNVTREGNTYTFFASNLKYLEEIREHYASTATIEKYS